MGRYDDVNPRDIDPETGAPYANYSSPALDTSFHDGEMAVDDEPAPLDELRELLKGWKCAACIDGLTTAPCNIPISGLVYTQQRCRTCDGTGKHPDAVKAKALLEATLATLEPVQLYQPDEAQALYEGEDGWRSDPRYNEDGELLCTSPTGHEWPRALEEDERCLCIHCGADGDG